VVVHANADDIARKFDAGGGTHGGGAAGSRERAVRRHERTVGEGHTAQVIMEILNLRTPLLCKQPLEAGTSRPSGARLRKCTYCRCIALDTHARGEGTVVIGLSDRRAGLDATISETARAIQQEGRGKKIAEPPASCAEIVKFAGTGNGRCNDIRITKEV